MQAPVKKAPAGLKGIWQRVAAFIKKIFLWTDSHEIVQCVILAPIINLIIESLSRHSVIDAFGFTVLNFIFFLFSSSVIFATLCVANFFVKRYAMLVTLSSAWIILGIINCIVRSFRETPFEANDLLVLKSGFEIIFMYLNIFEIIGIVILSIALISAIVLMFIKMKKHKIRWKRAIIALVCALLFASLLLTSLVLTGIAPQNFTSLVEAYNEYGFIYCFGSSLFNRGIDKPSEYSQEYMNDILSGLEGVKDPDTEALPNIIYIQLESFFDVKYLKDLEFSDKDGVTDPVANFTSLKENYTSGFLTVPSIGAGTANTEFEVMSGMRVFHFGTGEYPYKTILLKSTCESIAYNYKDYGYFAHAIHNNTGVFYDRNLVFKNLGFDRYNSLEYMTEAELNPIGWAKDKVLVDAVIGALDSTQEKDYVHAISVQAHGRYPSEKIDDTQSIFITPESLEKYEDTYGKEYEYVNEMEYFVNQIHEMDNFIAELTSRLEEYDEDVIVVFYGDHLPSLSIENKDLSDGNIYQTEYVIWHNSEFEMEENDKDLSSYQLSAYVSYQLGVNNGIVSRIHQKNFKKPFDKYEEYLEAVEYDMLYGKDYLSGGKELYTPTDMKMGLYDLTLDSMSYDVDNGLLTVEGTHYNGYCMIYVNGKHYDTEFLSKNKLTANVKLKDGDEISVIQMSARWMIKLGYSQTLVYKEAAPNN